MDFGNNPANPDTLKILDKLRQAGKGGLTLSEIYREVFSNNKSSEKVSSALEELEAAGLAFCKNQKTNGRTAERWVATSS